MGVSRRSGRSSVSMGRQRDTRSRSGDMEQVEERRPHPRPAPQAGAAAARRLRLRRLHRDEEDRRMAETAGMRLVPHVWGTAVVLAASLHVHAILRSEEHTSELQSLMRNSYAVFCLKKKIHSRRNK